MTNCCGPGLVWSFILLLVNLHDLLIQCRLNKDFGVDLVGVFCACPNPQLFQVTEILLLKSDLMFSGAEHNTPKLDKNIKITVEQKYLFSLPSTFSCQASGAHPALAGICTWE